MTRLDMVKERLFNTLAEDMDKQQAKMDIQILLEEIHERDILIGDFREQIAELKRK